MSNTTPSPLMGMPIPTVSVDPSPDWATNINASLSIVDSHNHSPGQGDQVTPDGLLINSDLTMASNNLVVARSIRFDPQGSPIAGASDLGCLYESGGDLYYNDASANQVRITQGGSVTGSSGTITGLPSGTASAAYSGGTFTFQSATLTPANFAVGPIAIGRNAASSKTVTLAPNAAQAGNFSLTFPAALPGSTNYLTLDTSGNIAVNPSGITGTSAVVLNISPNLTTPTIGTPTITTPAFVGVPTGTITGGSYTPTLTAVTGSAWVQLVTTQGNYIRVGNVVTAGGYGGLSFTGATPAAEIRFSLPVATNDTHGGCLANVDLVNSSAGSLAYGEITFSSHQPVFHFNSSTSGATIIFTWQVIYLVS